MIGRQFNSKCFKVAWKCSYVLSSSMSTIQSAIFSPLPLFIIYFFFFGQPKTCNVYWQTSDLSTTPSACCNHIPEIARQPYGRRRGCQSVVGLVGWLFAMLCSLVGCTHTHTHTCKAEPPLKSSSSS